MSAKNSEKKLQNLVDELGAPADKQPSNWFSGSLHLFIVGFSIVWFLIVIVYISMVTGWTTFSKMDVNEFIGIMAGTTLPLAIMWLIVAYIDRGSSFRNETSLLRDSLSQVIFPDSNGNDATRMLANAIKSEVAELKDAVRDACAQSEIIKRDLTQRVADLRELTSALDKYSSQTMLELNSEVKKLVDNFNFVAEKATSATTDFRVNTMQMRDDSEKLVGILRPMVNEMVTAAEHVKEVVNVNNDNIAKAQDQLNQYSATSQSAIATMIASWAEKGENLEKTFLRTSENCEELFRRLDSGISHIENSIKEQKQVVETQSAMIDKNSSYLDNKLGEYGKLISLEVEAMVQRSGTLEKNIKSQLKNLRDTSAAVSDSFNRLGDDVENKRRQLADESAAILNNVDQTVSRFNQEMSRLQDFYASARDKSDEFNHNFAAAVQNLQGAGDNLLKSMTSFHSGTAEIFNKFDNVNNTISDNIAKMTDSSSAFSQQSEKNAEFLQGQEERLQKYLQELGKMSAAVAELHKKLLHGGQSLGTVLNSYEGKITDFGQMVDNHLQTLQAGFSKAEQQIEQFDQKFNSASLNTFMRRSSDIISELEALSIDINAVFNKDGRDEELWKRYYEGDHGVFSRYLTKNMTKKQVAAIRDDYEAKSDFRVLVDRYLDDFDKLVAAARDNERAGTLLALLSGSDIGKVYYILARALGKVN